MEKLEVLNKLQEYLRYTDENLYLYFVENLLIEAVSKKHRDGLNLVKRELMKPRADKKPNEIWMELGWTSGKLFTMDTFDLHCILYYRVKYFIFDNIDTEYHKILVPMFNFQPNYRNSQKSDFHKHSKSYNIFLAKRIGYIEEIERMKEKLLCE